MRSAKQDCNLWQNLVDLSEQKSTNPHYKPRKRKIRQRTFFSFCKKYLINTIFTGTLENNQRKNISPLQNFCTQNCWKRKEKPTKSPKCKTISLKTCQTTEKDTRSNFSIDANKDTFEEIERTADLLIKDNRNCNSE